MKKLSCLVVAAVWMTWAPASPAAVKLSLFGPGRRAKPARKAQLPPGLGKFVVTRQVSYDRHRVKRLSFDKTMSMRWVWRELPPSPRSLEPQASPAVESYARPPSTFVPPPPRVNGPPLQPTPEFAMPGPMGLYSKVEYEDLDNVHPCAIPKIVRVLDPCYDPRSCCGTKCVFVKICVPPCGCPKVRISSNGRKIKYDYGEYEVEIKTKKGRIKVDYDD